jgi:hypothetical protein
MKAQLYAVLYVVQTKGAANSFSLVKKFKTVTYLCITGLIYFEFGCFGNSMPLTLFRKFNVFYSIFAGILAFPIYLQLIEIFPKSSSQHREFVAAVIAIFALIGAAFGSFIARRNKESDCGYIAALWTAVFIGIFICLTYSALGIWLVATVRENSSIDILPAAANMLIFGVITFVFAYPLCLFGTVLFNLIDVVSKLLLNLILIGKQRSKRDASSHFRQ